MCDQLHAHDGEVRVLCLQLDPIGRHPTTGVQSVHGALVQLTVAVATLA
jgi:hypothetical protein